MFITNTTIAVVDYFHYYILIHENAYDTLHSLHVFQFFNANPVKFLVILKFCVLNINVPSAQFADTTCSYFVVIHVLHWP